MTVLILSFQNFYNVNTLEIIENPLKSVKKQRYDILNFVNYSCQNIILKNYISRGKKFVHFAS